MRAFHDFRAILTLIAEFDVAKLNLDPLKTSNDLNHRMAPMQPFPLLALDPLVQELRLLCRDKLQLIGQRTALVNQLQQALSKYYPAALQAFDDWTLPASWKFLERHP